MMLKKLKPLLYLLLLLLLLSAATLILAQTSASFDLFWNIQNNGGGQSSSASYQINGSIGQNISSPPGSSSSSYQLKSGYWVLGSGKAIFLPVIYSPS